MRELISNIRLQVHQKTFVKDPETSELGKNLIRESILLIDEIGFENFTFKKLGERIKSNESSVYRYFENKHKLLLYLASWYWSYLEYRLVFATNNIEDPCVRLKIAVEIVTEKVLDDTDTAHINEAILSRIIIAEFSKVMHTKEVDQENKEGFFLIYKRLNARIVSIIKEINPTYPFAESLVSTVISGALHQHFLSEHLESLSSIDNGKSVSEFYTHLITNTIQN
ncbi:TetR/AcrR family transcriptional regulator [Flavobacterium sp.]|uniref:TetR/AcrR family transcriptional regulator n=1 Tax=Flavobacterium sp. TaxID=239 RepID=UPI002610AFFA|nr:TetR/AcrR family transcriptional regulator [Flavobacterium sp.]